jgi:WD40 repeat protein
MCKGDKHKSHKTIENSKYALLYKDFIKHMPLRFKSIEEFIVNFEKVANNFKNQIQDDINNTINNINDLINNLVKIRAQYAKNIKEKYEQGSMALNILKLFYWNFYIDYSNMTKCEDIFLLKYLININYEFINMELTYNKKMFDQLNIIKNQADILKKSTDELFYLKFEYQKLPREYSISSKLFGHKDQITSLLVLKDEKLLSGSLDFSIRIWEEKQINLFINTEKIEEFVKPITCLCQISDGRILSSAIKDNNTIRIWNKNSKEYECETTLTKHQGVVTCIIQLNDGRLVSGSKDKRIIIYIKKIFTKSFEINEHTEEISSLLQLKTEFLASSSFDKYIKIFKLNENNYEIIQSIKAHDNFIHKIIELSNGNLISCSLDKNIKIFNLENGIYIENFKFIEEK